MSSKYHSPPIFHQHKLVHLYHTRAPGRLLTGKSTCCFGVAVARFGIHIGSEFPISHRLSYTGYCICCSIIKESKPPPIFFSEFFDNWVDIHGAITLENCHIVATKNVIKYLMAYCIRSSLFWQPPILHQSTQLHFSSEAFL